MASYPGPAAPRTPPYLAFWRERHLCTLTTLRPDGTPHVVPVGVTYDPEAGLARVITDRRSTKVRNIRGGRAPDGARVAVCQVDGGRWATLEGRARVRTDPALVADAERRYAERYGRTPRPTPTGSSSRSPSPGRWAAAERAGLPAVATPCRPRSGTPPPAPPRRRAKEGSTRRARAGSRRGPPVDLVQHPRRHRGPRLRVSGQARREALATRSARPRPPVSPPSPGAGTFVSARAG